MPAHRHPLRSHIIALFRRGDLVSLGEAAIVSGATKQAIGRWLKAERINITAARLAHIARQRTRAQLIEEGKGPRRRPSKAEMRKVIADAMAETVRRRQEASAPEQ